MTADDRRPVPPPPVHPDLDTLADLHADALDRSTAERVAAHAAQCPQCRAVLSGLDAVRADLRRLPSPPMPAGVVARLDAALADLRRGDLGGTTDARAAAASPGTDGNPTGTTQTGTGQTSTGQTSTSQTGTSQTGTSQTGTSETGTSQTGATPTGIGQPGATPTGTGQPGTGQPGRSKPGRSKPAPSGGTGSTAAGDAGPVRARPAGDRAGMVTDLAAARRRRRRLVRGLGAAAAAVAVVGAGASVATLAVTGSGDNATDSAAGGGGGAAERSAVDAGKAPGAAALAIPSYDRNTLRSNLPQIAQQSAVSIITGRDDTGPAGAMADAGRRTACAGTIGGSTGELEAVQRIRYEGRMAYVFVFQSGGRRTAYVVSDDCGTSPALPAAVLDTVS